MNILITGATGFVGLHFLNYLKESGDSDIALFAISRTKPTASFQNVTWLPFTEDFETLLSNYQIDTVVHFLGKAHDTKNTSAAQEYYKINFEWTRQLYDAYLRSSATKFVFLSSIKAVGDEKTQVKNALDVSKPQTPYADSKMMAEAYIRSAPVSDNKKFYILRPVLMYGPGVKGNLQTLVKFSKKGLPYPFSAFSNKRSYLYIDNLNMILKKVITGNYSSFTLNIANEDPIGTKELMELIAAGLHKKASGIHVPEKWIRLLAKVGDAVPFFPLNSEKLEKITSSFVVDTTEMTQTLGFTLPYLTRSTIQSILK